MSALFFLLAIFVVLLAVYVGKYSGRLWVDEACTMPVPIAQVEAMVRDFSTWPAWHPWLEHDRDAKPEIHGQPAAIGAMFSWASQRAGRGSMTHERFLSGGRTVQRLSVLEPFVYRGRVEWTLFDEGGQTRVRWQMKGRVGFKLRAFARTIQEMAAFDARFALRRMRDVLAPDGAVWRIAYPGLRDVPALAFASRLHEGPIRSLADDLASRLAAFREEIAAHPETLAGVPVVAYLRTNMKLRTTRCAYGFPLEGAWPEGFEQRELPAHRAYVVRYQGPASDREMAWYQAMQAMRAEGLAPSPNIPPYERYLDGGVLELCLVVSRAS